MKMSQATTMPTGTAQAPTSNKASQPSGKSSAGPKITVNDANMTTLYANFCRVTGTPEELLIDFGMNTQGMANESEKITLDHRVVLNFYTAKRLLAALNMAVQRHEGLFGELETNIQKRVVNQPKA